MLQPQLIYAQKTQKVVVKDVTYILSNPGYPNEAYVFSIPKKAKEVTIVGKVEYKGNTYDVKGPFEGSYGLFGDVRVSAFRPDMSPSLESIIMDDQFDEVPKEMFRSASKIRKIVLPNTIKTIREYAFAKCTRLIDINIPSSVNSIEQLAFSECECLASIDIPSSVKSIGKFAFNNCRSLLTITGLRPDITISQDAFYHCAFDYNKYTSTFSYFSNKYIYDKVSKWQKRGEFESQNQYEVRVTKDNQNKLIKQLLQKSIEEYTLKHLYKGYLRDYDADNQQFLIESTYGNQYVKVPREKAAKFKNRFGAARFVPSFVISGNDLVLSDLSVYVDGTEYKASKDRIEFNNIESNINLPEIELPNLSSTIKNSSKTEQVVDKSLDYDIPVNKVVNNNTFAVIIGNEKYQQVMAVPYANNDARVFREYCKKTLGLPEKNIRFYANATYGSMIAAINDIQRISKAYKGNINVIFFYAGHGIPDEANGDAYLLPVDADGNNIRVCYPLSQLYKELDELMANRVVCFMDCCFSGAERGNGMIVAARGVAIKVKEEAPKGNTIVFTAASGKQTAFPFAEKGHGMFTYYLLKKIHDSKGNCTLGELGEFIIDEVGKQSVVNNGKEQTPVVLTSSGLGESWKNYKLK